MAADESGSTTTWLVRRLQAFVAAQERDRGDHEPQRRGLVVSLCILASVLLWFSFAMRERYTRVVDLPIEVVNLQADRALTVLPPDRVRAQVEGQGIQLMRLYYNPPALPVDAAAQSVDLAAVAPEVVSGVRLEAIAPRTIDVQTEARLTRRIPIESRIAVATDPGHHVVGGLQLIPDSVTVSGAQSLVASLNAWPTEAIRLPATGDSLSARVALVDSLTGLIRRSTESIRVAARVMEFTEGTRRVPVRISGAPPGQRVTLDPPTVQVVYQVPLDQFDQALQSDGFYASVAYEVVRRDTTGSVLPVVQVPDGLIFREVRTEPAALRYYFYVLEQ